MVLVSEGTVSNLEIQPTLVEQIKKAQQVIAVSSAPTWLKRPRRKLNKSGTDSRQHRAAKRATMIRSTVRSALNPVIPYTSEYLL